MYKSIFVIKNDINCFNFLCIGSHKRLNIQYVLQLEMTGRVFSSELYFFSSMVLHFSTLIDAYAVHSMQFIRGYPQKCDIYSFLLPAILGSNF